MNLLLGFVTIPPTAKILALDSIIFFYNRYDYHRFADFRRMNYECHFHLHLLSQLTLAPRYEKNVYENFAIWKKSWDKSSNISLLLICLFLPTVICKTLGLLFAWRIIASVVRVLYIYLYALSIQTDREDE